MKLLNDPITEAAVATQECTVRPHPQVQPVRHAIHVLLYVLT